MASGWDLTALINAADPKAGIAERHLWLVRLMEWLRHAPSSASASAREEGDGPRTPLPALRLKHLLRQIEQHPELQARLQGVVQAFWRDIDAAALYADFGLGARLSFGSELLSRVQGHLLPGTPETRDLAALFKLLFEPADAPWVAALDATTCARVAAFFGPGPERTRAAWLDAATILASHIQASGHASALRQRMDPALRAAEPFRQLGSAMNALRAALQAGDAAALRQTADGAAVRREAAWVHALIDACRTAAGSVMPHLESYGVSVNIVFDLDQLEARCQRLALLVNALLADDAVAEGHHLVQELVGQLHAQRSVRALFARHYSLLARQVAERSAETGEHYITTSRDEYREMLRRAAGGGAVIAGTTFAKFAIGALGLGAFWGGFWAGVNYAASFVLVMLLHWTVATKQPAMTAPALAATLPVGSRADDADIERFVDRVAQLIRSQVAGIVGNVVVCGPLVLAVQLLAVQFMGAPLVGAAEGQYSLNALTLLGPTALFAAFTGVLLFASSLIAGWAENWFVLHRLDSAIAWNPRCVALLGATRAQRWALWWRRNVSGMAANVSLGLMLGLVPALAGFFALPLEVRHVTLATGQVAAALGALGWGLLLQPLFWWCIAGIVVIGVLNVTVSFFLAFKVALRSRGVRVADRSRIYAAVRARLRKRPMSFLRPPPFG
jgi:site-specific recombinase